MKVEDVVIRRSSTPCLYGVVRLRGIAGIWSDLPDFPNSQTTMQPCNGTWRIWISITPLPLNTFYRSDLRRLDNAVQAESGFLINNGYRCSRA